MMIQRVIKWIVCLTFVGVAAGGSIAVALRERSPESVFVVPSEVRALPGRLTIIRCQSPAAICWHVCHSSSMPDVLPLDEGKTVVFVSTQSGRYELWAWSAANGNPTEAARCVVHVEGAAPIDPILDVLKSAWAKESNPNKARYRDALLNVYRMAIADTVRQAATVGELYSTMRRSAQSVLPDDALLHVRAALSNVLQQRLPTTDAPMTEEIRKRCIETFSAVSEALQKLETVAIMLPVNCSTCR